MTTETDPYVDMWRAHVQVLSEDIGPRGSTTESERLAAEYCRRTLAGAGWVPRLEEFTSARSIYQPHLLAAAALLLAFVIYPLAGRISAGVAAVLAVLALVSDLLELGFRGNMLRLIVSKGRSQNVVAVVPPAEQHRRDLVLIGHLDSHRTPLIFSTPRWLATYKAFTMVAFVAFFAQAVLYVVGSFTQWPWIWPVTGVSGLAAILLAALCIQADSTPFNRGANDNATAAGLLLTLSRALRSDPLRYTRVWLVCTGCEEVQHYGAIDFFRRHRNDLRSPNALVFEMLGCAGPAWLLSEGIIVPFRASRPLVALAERLSAANPAWQAHPTRISGGNTEMADALRYGVPALTIAGMTPAGDAPYWHQAGDTYDKLDPEVMARAYDLAWAMIRAIDAGQVD